MKKLEILPDWVYTWDLPTSLLKQTNSEVQKLTWMLNQQNTISQDKDLHQQKQFAGLTKWINSQLNEVKNDLNLNCEYLEVCLMWANKSLKNNWHHIHTHPTSWASGIIYLTESNSQTWFSKQNFWVTSSLVNIKPEGTENHILHKFPSTPGTMVIFPSSLHHSVNEHTLDHPRYTVSFNAFPCGRVGSYHESAGIHIKPFSKQ